MIKFLHRWLGPKRVKLERHEVMSGEDVRKAFGAIGAENKFWAALDVLIDNQLLDAVSDVANPDLSENPGKLSHGAGKVEALSLLKSRIEEFKPYDGGLGKVGRRAT